MKTLRLSFLSLMLFGATLCVGQTVSDQPPEIFKQASAEILDIRVIAEIPGRYIGWPSIVRTSKDHLIAVFSGDRTAHVDDHGKLQMVRSVDGGKTWSKPRTLVDTPLDDRDAGIVEAADGALIVGWFTAAWNASLSAEDKKKWLGNLTIRSTDHGKTWSKPYHTKASTPHGASRLSDGRLLVMGQYPHESQKKPYILAVEESTDHGKSWDVVSKFDVPKGVDMLTYDEPYLFEVEPGNLLVFFRDCYNGNPIRISRSADFGRTWSKPIVTPMRGLPPHVIKLKDGTLVCVYGRRRDPLGEFACISRDGGKTWDVKNEIRLAAGLDGDLGYPCSAELADGSIWTVYYQRPSPSKKPCLMGTHWRLRR